MTNISDRDRALQWARDLVARNNWVTFDTETTGLQGEIIEWAVSAGSQTKPCFGSWGYSSWHDPTYTQPPVEIRGLERARHAQLTREWLASFPAREKKHYREIPRQLRLEEVS